jgi:hypothetical protein
MEVCKLELANLISIKFTDQVIPTHNNEGVVKQCSIIEMNPNNVKYQITVRVDNGELKGIGELIGASIIWDKCELKMDKSD